METSKNVLAIAGTVIATLVVGFTGFQLGYTNGFDVQKSTVENLEDRIEMNERVDGLDLSSLVGNVASATNKLGSFLDEFDDLGLSEFKSAHLQDTIQIKEQVIEELRSDLKKLQDDRTELVRSLRLGNAENGTLHIKRGESKFVLKNSLPLAFLDERSSEAYIKFDGKNEKIIPGAQMSRVVGNVRVVITLSKLTYHECRFEYQLLEQEEK